jgi:biotin operon repressor
MVGREERIPVPDDDPPDVLAVLEDEYAQGILRATHSTAMSAPQLAETLDASRPTIYRRIEELQKLDLLTEGTQMDADGHHRNVYQSRLDRVVITPGESGFSVSIDRSEHPADRLTDMWEEL